jgi:hypothetical protein
VPPAAAAVVIAVENANRVERTRRLPGNALRRSAAFTIEKYGERLLAVLAACRESAS